MTLEPASSYRLIHSAVANESQEHQRSGQGMVFLAPDEANFDTSPAQAPRSPRLARPASVFAGALLTMSQSD